MFDGISHSPLHKLYHTLFKTKHYYMAKETEDIKIIHYEVDEDGNVTEADIDSKEHQE